MKNSRIKIEVSLFEAAVIRSMRQFNYGSLTIYKKFGEPERIEVGVSILLDPNSGRELEAKDRG